MTTNRYLLVFIGAAVGFLIIHSIRSASSNKQSPPRKEFGFPELVHNEYEQMRRGIISVDSAWDRAIIQPAGDINNLLNKDLLPGIFLLGAQNAATASLHRILSRHPSISRPVRAHLGKEPNFFDSIGFQDDPYSLTDYLNLWDTPEGVNKTRIDSSDGYLASALAPYRVRSLFGNRLPKFVVVLRNPTDRAYAAYRTYRESSANKKSMTPQAFQDLALAQIGRLKEYRDQHRKETVDFLGHFLMRDHTPKGIPGIIASGIYGKQIRHWLDVFPHDQFYLLEFDDVITNHAATVPQLLEWLGLDSSLVEHTAPDDAREPNVDQMLTATRLLLTEFYSSYNSELCSMLDLSYDWCEINYGEPLRV